MRSNKKGRSIQMRKRQTPHHLFGYNPKARPGNAGAIWRTICWATSQIAVSGDLSDHHSKALPQLQGWVEAGITDIMDMRCERSDESFVHAHAPHIKYHWLGVDDDGGTRDASWFEAIAATSAEILKDPSRKIMVHCHMGVNRGPSAAFTTLITQGHDPVEALHLIRNARPVASMMYSFDAIQWHAQILGKSESETDAQFTAVTEWHEQNPLDVGYCVSAIGNRYAA